MELAHQVQLSAKDKKIRKLKLELANANTQLTTMRHKVIAFPCNFMQKIGGC